MGKKEEPKGNTPKGGNTHRARVKREINAVNQQRRVTQDRTRRDRGPHEPSPGENDEV